VSSLPEGAKSDFEKRACASKKLERQSIDMNDRRPRSR
jgi:hypothetical protein